MTAASEAPVGGIATAWFDDAAVFPPGSAPLPAAVAAHRRHREGWYGEFVGPFVISAGAMPELCPLVEGRPRPLEIALTLPDGPGQVANALDAAARLPVVVRALEIRVPDGMSPAEVVSALTVAVPALGMDVYVEIPRDGRREALLAALSGTRFRVKFRTGGVCAESYPSVAEIADSVGAAVAANVPFKVTAGLHHAVRNTDPHTGFDQHGFLNLLLATDAATRGVSVAEVHDLLLMRDKTAVADLVRRLGDDRLRSARARFTSFGTCSIAEPVADLVDLGLIHSREGTVPA